ncbi:MAG: hypothetical protein ABH829_00220 [archaeon]
MNFIKASLSKMRRYRKISAVDEISRRYFVMNGFDGALVTLGVIMGSYFSGVHDAYLIIGAVLGGALAMALSGASGAFFTERAERRFKLRRIERAMLTKLKDTQHGRASVFAYYWTAFINSSSSAAASVIILIPIMLNAAGLVQISTAVYGSIGIAFAMIFALGVYLAKLSKDNAVAQGLKMVFVGLICAGIILLFA